MESGRVSDFIKGYILDRSEELRVLGDKAEKNGVPIIRKETEAFIVSVMMLRKPERILELGTATGYSSILMARTTESYVCSRLSGHDADITMNKTVDARIDTIEDWEPRFVEAGANIEEAGLENRINLIRGDAAQVMKELDGSYDLIFIDAAKGQYPDYLEEAIRLTHEGAVIIADNIFQDGEIMESKYIVERRDRTIHKRMREFLNSVTSDDRLATAILPVGDGITFSVRTR